MMTLHNALELLSPSNLHPQIVGPEDAQYTGFTGVTTDSRKVQPGDLFVALAGEKFDGHDFLDQVKDRGAVAALVSHAVPSHLPQLQVSDTRIALGALAKGWRLRFDLPVIAVTGSNGKTTTKEMIASILAAAHEEDNRLATIGNLNNDIGLPLTLLRLRTHHRAAVVELGMNHPGETDWLANIAQPTVTLINNAQREHQEFMQSVTAVANEHALAIQALPPHGVAVFPADEVYTPIWNTAASDRRIIDFSVRASAETPPAIASVMALAYLQADHSVIHLATPAGETTVRLQAPGLHNVRNAAAAAAVAVAIGIPLECIHRGLENFAPVQGRLQHVQTASGLHLIDDTYNANPDSVIAAIDVLAACPGPHLLILGDMGEVGSDGPAFHAEIGVYAAERGIEKLLATGELMRHAVAAFSASLEQTQKQQAMHFEDIAALMQYLGSESAHLAHRSVLVKGSRFMRMERVLSLLNPAGNAGQTPTMESH